MKENNTYECYSKKQYGYLTMKGIRYIRSFKHNKTGKTCWVYEVNEDLSRALTHWTKNKVAA